tara:strand:+ start:3020 stop:3670 length:651 start_codon:yes stop_codon:yes gene_type:complete
MNTKIVSLLTAFGLCINAAFAGNSVRVGYASDYFYRGAQKAEESLQASLMLGHSLGSLEGSLHICSNQAVDTGNDSYHMGAGVGTSFLDGLLSAYAGINHFEDVPGNSLAEAEVRVSVDALLSPSVTLFRDLDESLYTYELGLSHVLETKVADLSVSASYGNTETSSSSDTDYYGLGVSASKSLSDTASLGGSVDYVDADNIDNEFVFGVGLTFNF